MAKITDRDVDWVRFMWKDMREGTEVVKLVDDLTGKISILIKEKK